MTWLPLLFSVVGLLLSIAALVRSIHHRRRADAWRDGALHLMAVGVTTQAALEGLAVVRDLLPRSLEREGVAEALQHVRVRARAESATAAEGGPSMLEWPHGWPRTTPQQRKRGAFNGGKRSEGGGTRDLTVAAAISRVQDEVRRFGGRDLRIDAAMPTRNDGLPRSDARNPDDPGVVVSFRLPGGKPVVFPCDRYTRVEQNLAAVAATLEAKRAIERHGVSTIEREFEGYAALPAGAPPAAKRQAHEVLEVAPTASRATVEAAYRALALQRHPDRTGDDGSKMRELVEARDAMLRALP